MTQIDIPRKIEFYANIAYVQQGQNVIKPVFQAGHKFLKDFCLHKGDVEVEIVLAGDDFNPVNKRIRFRRPFEKNDLVPLV